jgi:NAD(P)-dependent dehydrogenase (short-subunit alcohol dehydrogenase family)
MTAFEGKTAIVTGAGSGIGAAIATEFARLGATVGLVDVDVDPLNERAEELSSAGFSVAAYPHSVLDKGLLNELVEDAVRNWGTIDILINNAGIIRDGFVEKLSEEDWDAVVDVNLKGAFLCCQAIVPYMKERRYGKIVNITSSSWLGRIGQSNYAASKGGLVSLTRTLALELARDNINVNAVAPGLIDTPMTQRLPGRVRERLIRMQPNGQMGSVDDVVGAVCFLASDSASFITGQILHVDGGKSCGLVSL